MSRGHYSTLLYSLFTLVAIEGWKTIPFLGSTLYLVVITCLFGRIYVSDYANYDSQSQ
jgi:hypothetical protein